MKMIKITSPDCMKLLPKVLIDYLWKLAINNETETQVFTLKTKVLGDSGIQEIYHSWDVYSSKQQVFGFDPVETVIEVNINKSTSIMTLKEEDMLYSA